MSLISRLVAGLVACTCVSGSPIEIEKSTITLVAWNLAGFSPIQRERVPNFIPALLDLDAEIIALVEVNSDWVPAELAAELNDLGACYHRKILPQSASLNIALLHRCEIRISDVRFVDGSDLGRTGLRKALAVNVVAGEADFVLITVHLKAGRSQSDRNTRTQQAIVLREFINTELVSEPDIILAGDYNMVPGDDDENFDAFGDSMNFVSNVDLAGEFSHIHSGGRPGRLLDGFGITSEMDEYIAGSLRVFPMHRAVGLSLEEFKERISDHLPIVARIRISRDND